MSVRVPTCITRGYAVGKSIGRLVEAVLTTHHADVAELRRAYRLRMPQWCFRIHGHAKGIAPGSYGEWGPFAKRYRIARSGGGSGVFVTSDRNGTADFRVWNFSGATITNVQLRTDPQPGTQVCAFGDIPNFSVSGTCFASIGGSSFLNVYYNGVFLPVDTIGYDQ